MTVVLTRIGPEEQLCLKAQDQVLRQNPEQIKCETFFPAYNYDNSDDIGYPYGFHQLAVKMT